MTQNALQTLIDRGFVQQTTDATAIASKLASGPQRIYTGYDPTGESLHVGHLVTLMALAHLERHGHRPIVILGGGTGHVGDPSGKTEMRPVLAAETIASNVAKLTRQIGQVLHVAADKTCVYNNADWLLPLNYIAFLRDVGRHFSVNRMLSFDAYKQRLERGLSFIEFNYQLLQAYDFYVLNKDYGCDFQLGGDDQWGNIVAGVDLCRRMSGARVEGITVPLLTTASGAKMGKTAAGAVWLDANKLPPYAYYQYWVNTEDADVVRFLRLFTFLPLVEIAAVADLEGAERNVAKSILAYEATAVVHGAATAAEVHAAALGAFGGRSLDPAILPSSTLPRQAEADASSIPSYTLQAAELTQGLSWIDLLVRLEASKSRGEARRLIDQGGLRTDTAKVTDAQANVDAKLFAGGAILLRAGKKRVYRLVLA
jgi:tyrosyl-tRNA synthetase